MNLTESHSTPSSGKFNPRRLVKNLSPYVFILFYIYIYHYKLVKHLIQYFPKHSALAQMIL